jgi:hypothetical protein
MAEKPACRFLRKTMKIYHVIGASWLASIALASIAQTPPAQRDPQAANAAVPRLAYQSAFDGYMPSNQAAPAPDKVWMAANEKVGSAGGHGAHAMHPAPTVPGDPDKPRKEGK